MHIFCRIFEKLCWEYIPLDNGEIYRLISLGNICKRHAVENDKFIFYQYEKLVPGRIDFRNKKCHLAIARAIQQGLGFIF